MKKSKGNWTSGSFQDGGLRHSSKNREDKTCSPAHPWHLSLSVFIYFFWHRESVCVFFTDLCSPIVSLYTGADGSQCKWLRFHPVIGSWWHSEFIRRYDALFPLKEHNLFPRDSRPWFFSLEFCRRSRVAVARVAKRDSITSVAMGSIFR